MESGRPMGNERIEEKVKLVAVEWELLSVVQQVYPNAEARGSYSYPRSFYVEDDLVAEAWLHPTEPGWMLWVKEAQ